MYINSLILPLISFIFISLFGKFFGKFVVKIFVLFCIFLNFLLSIFIFYEIGLCQSLVVVEIYEWIVLYENTIYFGLLFDTLTSVMLLLISLISFVVHLFSLDYMKNDPYLCRFLSYLSLFTFFMEFLVTSDNFLQMFIGWEGVGICSYLLINFWFFRILANKAALKAMIMNRIADVFFIFGIILIFIKIKSVNYMLVFNLIPFFINDSFFCFGFCFNWIDSVCFFLFIGAIGKSAQLFLHTWLPDAMEGPTPVSALLHAATMVTAGIFLVLRCSPIFEYSNSILWLISLFGCFTAFFLATIATFQNDIKKIIAYSTCSQLGYMFFSCGISNYNMSIFHLFNHAFFKALLFSGAGRIIHAIYDQQDIRKMGILVFYLPFSYIAIIIGSISIMGIPFLSGFHSKDLILELTYNRYVIDSIFIYTLGVYAAFFTALYSVRLIFLVFHLRSNRNITFLYEESIFKMFISIFFLSILSIIIGYLFCDLFIGFGTFFWKNSLFYFNIVNLYNIDVDFMHPLVKNLPFILSLLGFFVGIFIFYFLQIFHKILLRDIKTYIIMNNYFNKIKYFFYNAGFFNFIYNNFFLNFFELSYEINTKLIDKGFLELFGPYGIYKLFKFINNCSKIYAPFIIFFSICFISISICLILLFLFSHVEMFLFFVYNRGLTFILIFIFFYEWYNFKFKL